ncbi:sphingosine 1-phosphate receptor 3a [Electrophorus electricus]|uniref:G-protein coupled receptors family 1 profile domain-containing protein n=1 Tax=Electrophorus electricus TaxID=8005 RepID=A0AAY5EDD7_ELEEL|nr:sphingosine 1-phosphate receptor 3a [Electrophorus electricus]XP_035378996.1 sphingosine 1-phosphate receptor 3a [Electrophorus electricus]
MDLEPGMNRIIVTHYNHSGKWARPRSSDVCKTAMLLVVCVLIVLENATVLLALRWNKRLHGRMYLLIGNLALSDLLAGAAYAVNIFTSGNRTYYLTPAQWLAREGSVFVALSASTFGLLAVGVERHATMARVRPCEAGGRGRLLALLAACWAISLLIGALPSLGWNCLERLPECSTVLPLYAKSYVAFCVSVFSALLAAVVVLYVRIYRLVKSSGRRVSSRPSERSLALLRTVVIVLGVFVVCWAPLFLLLLLDVGCEAERCSVLYRVDWFIALAVLNSALNPLIYTLTSREMRAAFMRLLCCCCCRAAADGGGGRHGAPPLPETAFPTAENSSIVGTGGGANRFNSMKGGACIPADPCRQTEDASVPAFTHPDLLSVVLVKAGRLPSLGKF